jgi:hypothetical protein
MPDLQTAINRFVAETNKNPKPFVSPADPDKVLAAVKRGRSTSFLASSALRKKLGLPAVSKCGCTR